LTECQRIARDGAFSRATRAYVQYAAQQIEARGFGAYTNALQDRAHAKRIEAAKIAGHGRTADYVAELYVGWEEMVNWLESEAAIGKANADKMRERGWSLLLEVATGQRTDMDDQQPAEQFLTLVQTAITSGHAHIANPVGGSPGGVYESALGWFDSKPRGDLIGWVDGDDLYLEPGAAYRIATSMVAHSAMALNVGPGVLAKRLADKGMLESTYDGRYKVRRKLSGTMRSVYHLSLDRLMQHADEAPAAEGEVPF
jgi:hypothetical protein